VRQSRLQLTRHSCQSYASKYTVEVVPNGSLKVTLMLVLSVVVSLAK
jgi:hypothetical protein